MSLGFQVSRAPGTGGGEKSSPTLFGGGGVRLTVLRQRKSISTTTEAPRNVQKVFISTPRSEKKRRSPTFGGGKGE